MSFDFICDYLLVCKWSDIWHHMWKCIYDIFYRVNKKLATLESRGLDLESNLRPDHWSELFYSRMTELDVNLLTSGNPVMNSARPILLCNFIISLKSSTIKGLFLHII